MFASRKVSHANFLLVVRVLTPRTSHTSRNACVWRASRASAATTSAFRRTTLPWVAVRGEAQTCEQLTCLRSASPGFEPCMAYHAARRPSTPLAQRDLCGATARVRTAVRTVCGAPGQAALRLYNVQYGPGRTCQHRARLANGHRERARSCALLPERARVHNITSSDIRSSFFDFDLKEATWSV